VEQHNLWVQLLHGSHRAVTVVELPNDVVAVGFEHAPRAGAEAGVIIHDQDSLSHGLIVAQRRAWFHTAGRPELAVNRRIPGRHPTSQTPASTLVSSSLNGEPVVMSEVQPEGGWSMTTKTASTASSTTSTAHEPSRKERTMHPSTRRFSRGRITGLTLIAVLTLGLVYLHSAGGSTSASVPAGAHAGQLTLKNCTYN